MFGTEKMSPTSNSCMRITFSTESWSNLPNGRTGCHHLDSANRSSQKKSFRCPHTEIWGISYLRYIRNFLICVWFVWSGISSGLVHRVSSTAAGPRTNYLWLSSKSSHHRSNGWLGPHGYRLRPGVVGSARHSDSREHNVLNSALSLQTQIDIYQYCASS